MIIKYILYFLIIEQGILDCDTIYLIKIIINISFSVGYEVCIANITIMPLAQIYIMFRDMPFRNLNTKICTEYVNSAVPDWFVSFLVNQNVN